MAHGALEGQVGGERLGVERLDRLMELAQGGLERLWLQTVFRHGYYLPDKAQSDVPDHHVAPDFTYAEACALVSIEGPHHERPLQQRLDEQKRQGLIDAGMTVVVFDPVRRGMVGGIHRIQLDCLGMEAR